MSLSKFIEAQENVYDVALSEILQGRKRSHWMWFIFPQLKGLGRSRMAFEYGIGSLAEAQDYLNHELLGSRIREISNALLGLNTNNPVSVFGETDQLKLRSSMTLFCMASEAEDSVFHQVIHKYYGGEMDESTFKLLDD